MKILLAVACLWVASVSILQAPNNKRAAEQNGASGTKPTDASSKNKSTPSNSLPNGIVLNCNQGCEQGPQSGQNTQAASQHDDDVAIQRKIATFTKWLAIVGFLQFLALLGTLVLVAVQALIMRTHAVHLEKVASAALLNAKALINSERPWVMIQIKEERPAKDNSVGVFKSLRAFHLSIFNYGKSPAHITDCRGPHIRFLETPDQELPVPPDYGVSTWQKRFLSPRDSIPIGEAIYPYDLKVGPVTDAALQGQRHRGELVVYGMIEYSDGIKEYRTAFCYRHERMPLSSMGGHLIVCGPPVYNEYS